MSGVMQRAQTPLAQPFEVIVWVRQLDSAHAHSRVDEAENCVVRQLDPSHARMSPRVFNDQMAIVVNFPLFIWRQPLDRG